MIIAHKGWGGLPILIPLALCCVASIYMPISIVTKENAPILSTIFFTSALVVWLLGRKLNGAAEGVILIESGRDKEKPKKLKNQHTLFWVPMEWYALILMIISFLFYKST